MAVVGNFNFFLQLTWEFLDLKSERGGSVCWPNNKIIDSDSVIGLVHDLVALLIPLGVEIKRFPPLPLSPKLPHQMEITDRQRYYSFSISCATFFMEKGMPASNCISRAWQVVARFHLQRRGVETCLSYWWLTWWRGSVSTPGPHRHVTTIPEARAHVITCWHAAHA